MTLLSLKPAHADPLSVDVFLNGGSFLQAGSLINMSGIDIVAVTYSFGSPEPGTATWEVNTETPAGTRADFLGDGAHYQTFQWTGLSIAPGARFLFDGFDIDDIVSVTPLVVDSLIIDTTGDSLRNAFITATMANGTELRGSLLRSAWTLDQRFTLSPDNGSAPVPEPGTLLLLLTGAAGMARAVSRSGARRSASGRWENPELRRLTPKWTCAERIGVSRVTGADRGPSTLCGEGTGSLCLSVRSTDFEAG
jgi:hypothetical protein